MFLSFRIKQGQLFDNEVCDECFCLGRNYFECVPKECPECEFIQTSQFSHTCECICKECNIGEKLCQSSNICIKEEFWCDGIDHCSDDETDCNTPVQLPTDQRYSFSGKLCPGPDCSPGEKAVETEVETLDGCPYYKCLNKQSSATPTCPVPICPPGFEPKFQQNKGMKLTLNDQTNRLKRYAIKEDQLNCPRYECIEMEAETTGLYESCIYDGNTLTTFDKMVSQGDLCHHQLFKSQNFMIECKYNHQILESIIYIFIYRSYEL